MSIHFTYPQALKQVRCSADGSMIQNSGAQSVWIEYNGSAVEVQSGKTVKLQQT